MFCHWERHISKKLDDSIPQKKKLKHCFSSERAVSVPAAPAMMEAGRKSILICSFMSMIKMRLLISNAPNLVKCLI